jgi:hypothetical protein
MWASAAQARIAPELRNTTDPAKGAALIGRAAQVFASKAEAVLATPVNGAAYFITSADGGQFHGVTGAAQGTYSDNGGSYCGTQLIPSGGDGSSAIIRSDWTLLDTRFFGGDIQKTCDAIVSGSVVVITSGTNVTNYITVTGKSNFSIIMEGIVVPAGTLDNLSTGLFNFSGCTDFMVIPNIVNASYSSTLNCIYLAACTDFCIENGKIDVKYNSLDGSAGIQIATNTKRGKIKNNYIRTGYGVLVNSGVSGVDQITVENNDFIGQTAYGNTGPGDAIEINAPTYGATNISVIGNRFTGYTFVNASRNIMVGFANVTGVLARDNIFSDITGMIALHCEDGTSQASISENLITSGHIGVNIACNTIKNLTDITVTNNRIKMPVLDPNATYATGAGIKAASNQLAGGGEILGLDVSHNTVTGSGNAYNGILINDHQYGSINGNKVSGFPMIGLAVYASNVNSAGIKHTVISNNRAINNTTDNFRFSKGAPSSAYKDELVFEDVNCHSNISDDTPKFGLDVYSAYAFNNLTTQQPNIVRWSGGVNMGTHGAAQNICTVSVPNKPSHGQIKVRYTVWVNAGAYRMQESGEYTVSVGRQQNVDTNAVISAKYGNVQAQLIPGGTPTLTVSLAVTAMTGLSTENQTFNITATQSNSETQTAEIEAIVEYIGIGNDSVVTVM